jgi:hypothetical protein
MERGSDLQKVTMDAERHGTVEKTPLSIAMERGRG